MKPFFPLLIGNNRLLSQLGNEILSDRLGHAYILEGAAGTGKHTLALQIAAALACEKKEDAGAPLPCCECPACRKILSGKSPDVITIGRADKATIGVEPIREMRTGAFMAPNELNDKIYIFEDAQTMTPEAQNALLLILEEPPAYLRFLLLTDGSIPLLETVRSRAPTLRLSLLAPQDLEEHLLTHFPEAEILKRTSTAEFRELLSASGGSMGKAKSLLDPKLRREVLEERQTARTFAELAVAHADAAKVIAFLSTFGTRREDVIACFSTMLLCIRDLILLKQTDAASLCFFHDRESACNLAYRFTMPDLLRCAEEITNAMESLRKNANIRLTLTHFAMRTGLLP